MTLHPPALASEVLAELTSAAYHVVLRHGGLRSPFIDVELDLRRVLHTGRATDRPLLAPART